MLCAECFLNGTLMLKVKFDDLHTLFNTITFHIDLPYTTEQFTKNANGALTTWQSTKARAYLLKNHLDRIQISLLFPLNPPAFSIVSR